MRGEDWLDDEGEIEGEGPGERWSVGAIEVGADSMRGVVRSVVDASSTSFKRDDRKLGSPKVFVFVVVFTLVLTVVMALELALPLPVAPALAALDDSPFC
jgi:hypothetical protein